jgi:uncharacterized membrane protein
MKDKTPEDIEFEQFKLWKAQNQDAEDNTYEKSNQEKQHRTYKTPVNKATLDTVVPVSIRDYLSKFIMWSIVGTAITVCVVTIGAMIAPIIFIAVLVYGYYLLNRGKINGFFNINTNRNDTKR